MYTTSVASPAIAHPSPTSFSRTKSSEGSSSNSSGVGGGSGTTTQLLFAWLVSPPVGARVRTNSFSESRITRYPVTPMRPVRQLTTRGPHLCVIPIFFAAFFKYSQPSFLLLPVHLLHASRYAQAGRSESSRTHRVPTEHLSHGLDPKYVALLGRQRSAIGEGAGTSRCEIVGDIIGKPRASESMASQ